MSDCGGLWVACLAAPLLLVVLLVAGVSYVALQAARLVGNLALQGIELAGTGVALGVRAATEALQAAGTVATATAQWTGHLFESSHVAARLSSTATLVYQATVSSLQATIDLHAPASSQAALASTTPLASTMLASNDGGGFTPATQGAPSSATPVVVSIAPVADERAAVGAAQLQSMAVESLARASGVQAALDAELPLRLVAESRHAVELASARERLRAAHLCLQAGQVERAADLAQQAEAVLTSTGYQAHEELARAERTTVTAAVGNTLEDMGYDVRLARAKDNVALVGRRGHHTLAMVVRPSGHIEMDMAGFEGTDCEPEITALLVGLRRNGLMISRQCLTRHGRFSGGSLIRGAQRAGRPLEEVLAEMTEAPSNDRESLSTVVRANQPVAVNAKRLRQERRLFWQAQKQQGRRS